MVQHGDSGGPVEVHDTTGGLVVLGVISAGNVGDETIPNRATMSSSLMPSLSARSMFAKPPTLDP